jgi:hypothetical protein
MANLKQKLFSRRVDKSFIIRINSITKYTPDLAYLQQFEKQLLFVPDNWMSGHIDHDRICNEKLVYPTAFTHDQYSMVYKPLGIESFPIVLDSVKEVKEDLKWADPNRPSFTDKQARVRGQIWAVTPNEFLKLDKDKENGVVFTRKRVLVDIPLRRTAEGNSLYRVSDSDSQLFTKRVEGGKEYWTMPSGGAPLKIYPRRMWMYIGNQDYWKDMICDKGFELPSVKILRPRNPLLKDYFYWLREGDHNK